MFPQAFQTEMERKRAIGIGSYIVELERGRAKGKQKKALKFGIRANHADCINDRTRVVGFETTWNSARSCCGRSRRFRADELIVQLGTFFWKIRWGTERHRSHTNQRLKANLTLKQPQNRLTIHGTRQRANNDSSSKLTLHEGGNHLFKPYRKLKHDTTNHRAQIASMSLYLPQL